MSQELSTIDAVASTLTTGDARRLVLQTMMDIRSGKIDAVTGMAIAANMKVLNESMFAEVAVAKMQLAMKGEANNFGAVAPVGQRVLGK